MGRRSDHTREQLHEMAVAAAAGIIEREGLPAVTVRRVAEEIGYSVGTIYNLFDNLDALILTVNARTIDSVADRLAAVQRSGHVERDIDALLDAYLAFVDGHPRLWAAVYDYHMPEGSVLPAWFADRIARAIGIVEAALEPAFPNDSEGQARAARLLWAGLHGIFSLATSGNLQVMSARPPGEMAREMVGAIVSGARARGDRS